MLSASGSARCSLPAESVAVVNAVLWLPGDLNEMVASIIEKEEDLAHASGLQRCLQSLHRQTFGVSGIAQQMLLSEASLLEVAFSQHSIDFIDGVAPHRVESILDSLRASLALFDDSVWNENAAVLMSLPAHCSACDNFGHLTRDCMHFKGRAREEKGFLPAAQHVSGKYVLEKLGLTVDFRRVVGVNDQLWEVGSACGRDFNCLIDTIRQSLNIPASDALLDAVRDDLAQEFQRSICWSWPQFAGQSSASITRTGS